MSKLLLSYVFKTHLSQFRQAIIDNDTDKICRVLDIERELLRKCIDSEGNTPLLLAIEHSSLLTIRLLLAQGARPDQGNFESLQTPLNFVASKVIQDENSNEAKRSCEIIQLLLEYGAYIDKPSPRTYTDVFQKSYTGKETPLLTAVRKNNLPIIKLLIEKDANVNYSERESKIRPIHYSVSNGAEEVFDLLERSGALISSIRTTDGDNLLHWFCHTKDNDQRCSLLNKLIEQGCDIHGENWEIQTPLFLAIKNDMIQTSQILINNGARINQIDVHGYRIEEYIQSNGKCSELLHLIKRQNQTKVHQHLITTSMQETKVNIHGNNHVDEQITIDFDDEIIDSPIISRHLQNNSETTTDVPSNSLPAYVYPDRRRESDEMDTKYERIWEKLIPKRRLLRSFSRQRSNSRHSSNDSRT